MSTSPPWVANGPASGWRGAAALATPGLGRFSYVDGRDGARPLDVEFYRPAGFGNDSPILFVMHGTKRNAADYRDTWTSAAERDGCLLLCPEFPRETYSRAAYHLGGVVDRSRGLRPKPDWTFGVVERLFDRVKEVTGNASARYSIYGHSAGGQFVHRLALLLPEARFVAAVAANAGWYTMPSFDETFPYGLAGTDVTADELSAALGRRLIVLLGGGDTNADDPHLRGSARARRQGGNRLERGHAFYASAHQQARRHGVRSTWELVTVPRAAHSDGDMMPTAASLLFETR